MTIPTYAASSTPRGRARPAINKGQLVRTVATCLVAGVMLLAMTHRPAHAADAGAAFRVEAFE